MRIGIRKDCCKIRMILNTIELNCKQMAHFLSYSSTCPRPASINERRFSSLPVFNMTRKSLNIPFDDGIIIDDNFLRQRYEKFAITISTLSI